MCGNVGRRRPAQYQAPFLIEGLLRLEYRGLRFGRCRRCWQRATQIHRVARLAR